MPVAPPLAVLVTAAGTSRRFGGTKKELASLGDRSVLDASLQPFLALHDLRALVITAPPGRESELGASLTASTLQLLVEQLGPRFLITAGGETRRDSVRLGLEALARTLGLGSTPPCIVLIHDAARPWASAELVARVSSVASERGACVPVVPLVDTPKRIDPDGSISAHPQRSSFGAAQTPQGFRLLELLDAHRRAEAEGFDCTDDAELWARYVGPVAWTEGESRNRKITYPSDLGPSPLEGTPSVAGRLPFRIGQGWDIHRLEPGRRLMIGGVEIPADRGEDAHSDGDVLLHALIDALLGAAALGDIGTLFPPTDDAWKGADSRELLERVAALVRAQGLEPGNLDCTVILERPRLGPHRDAICESIATVLGIDRSAVSFKAKTNEGLGETGSGNAVEASVVVSLFPA